MRIENHSVEDYTQQGYQLEDIYKQIERCGRICYQSEDKITDDSYFNFVKRMENNKHYSVLEHGTVYLQINEFTTRSMWSVKKYEENEYSVVNANYDNLEGRFFVSTNLRVLLENGWLEDLRYLCAPTQYHTKRYSFKVHTSIGTSREFNRHRCLSVSEQSTRYCNFSKNKHGKKIRFIKPYWFDNVNGYARDIWQQHMKIATFDYMKLCKFDLPAQAARSVLPLDTATNVVYTAFEHDWEKVLKLRSSKAGAKGQHPDADIVGNMIYDLLHKQ